MCLFQDLRKPKGSDHGHEIGIRFLLRQTGAPRSRRKGGSRSCFRVRAHRWPSWPRGSRYPPGQDDRVSLGGGCGFRVAPRICASRFG